LIDAAAKGELVVFIVYDLPNRDCHAKASNGEICCTSNSDGTCNYEVGGDCSAGITDYKTNYIDPLSKLFGQYQDKVQIVAIIEPDSLPNLATNQADPHCGNSATTNAYKIGIPYAVNTIAANAPRVAQYLDAAHGGWLGWNNNINAFAQLVNAMGISSKLRGFSTNVANYQPLGIQCQGSNWCLNGQHQSDPCCADPCRLESQYNPANNELNYVAEVAAAFSSWNPHFVIDTGRNGVADMRKDCANWCNVRGAGIGLLPTTTTANTTVIDAYYWLKTPGESDGCTQTLPDGTQCKRFDSFCGSSDSIGSQSGEPRAPVAGLWFDYQVKQLAQNAHMGN
jgi:cellulose 1,4-beta-cellobiosidase